MALTPSAIPAQTQTRTLYVPDDLYIIGAVYGALLYLADSWFWQSIGGVSPQDMAYRMLEMIFESAENGDMNLIGLIVPVIRDPLPFNLLACDGGTYNRVDYPKLYAAIDSQYVIDADTFITPDMRGRAAIGSGQGSGLSMRTAGDIGGEEQHQLTVGEMPAHSHTDVGHSHIEVIAAPNVTTIGPGAPQPTAIPGAGITGSGSANLANTGGDGSHNNMQPFLVAKYAVIAR